MLLKIYQKFCEDGDIDAFTSFIHAYIEILMPPTGRVIDYDLWLVGISAVVLSDACEANLRSHYENEDIVVIHPIPQNYQSKVKPHFVF